MALTQARILEILESGDFEPLIGEFESETLECKGQPYGLDTDERKLELAKDVSGLANAAGGLLLVGFTTKKSLTHGEDEIDRVRAFPLGMFDPNQYRQVLAAWLWPPLDDILVQVFPSSADSTHGVAVIVVPAIGVENRPLLVAKTLLNSARKIELLFGYCERKQAQVVHYDVGRLHSLLRDGRRFDEEIRSNFQSLHSMIEQLRVAPTASPPISPQDVESRLDDALRAVRLYDQPAFVLAVVPGRALNLRALFESRNTPLVKLLEDPPELRQSGFDVDSGGNSRIVEGRLRRAVVEEYRLLEFHRDGIAIYVARGDRLCWGRRERQVTAYLINQLALVEMTYLFSLVAQQLYEGQLHTGDQLELHLRILRLKKGDRNLYLESGALDSFCGMDVRQAPSDSKLIRCEFSYNGVSPERAAVLLLSELYAWFGFEEDQIPYTTVSEEGRIVDPESISSVG